MKIEHISISRQSCFRECAKKYHFRYHLKVQIDQPTAPHFLFGSLFHKIAEEYVRRKGETSVHRLAKDVLDGKILMDDGSVGVLPKEYKSKLPKHLDNLERFTEKVGFEGELEYEFRYDLDPPHKREVTGFIDRLIQKGDNFFILDYKTGQSRYAKNQYSIRSDPQLRAYARVVQTQFGAKPENIKAALFYSESSTLVATAFNEPMLVEVERELLRTYKEIEQTNPEEVNGRTGPHCSRCEYALMCPFFAVSRQ